MTRNAPSRGLQVLSFALPVLKCAVCPACLSIFGGLFAGARMGLLRDEKLHGWLIAVALIADLFILWSAIRHHRRRSPLALCIAGGTLAISGHFVSETIEIAGFGLLMAASLQNAWFIRRHKHTADSCCAAKNTSRVTGPALSLSKAA